MRIKEPAFVLLWLGRALGENGAIDIVESHATSYLDQPHVSVAFFAKEPLEHSAVSSLKVGIAREEDARQATAGASGRQQLVSYVVHNAVTADVPRRMLQEGAVYSFGLETDKGPVHYTVLWRYSGRELVEAYYGREEQAKFLLYMKFLGAYVFLSSALILALGVALDARRRCRKKLDEINSVIHSIQMSAAAENEE
ncbi:hypothetical protein PAPHI01_2378 [Pancytospora philotis]|nr:hypothetical protein PAPHI01_2378 [Pancytospora philotis]